MACRIKVHSATMGKALGLVTSQVGKRQDGRIPSLEAVRLAADGDGVFIISTNFQGAIKIRIDAEAKGELAVPLAVLTALVRHFPADEEIAIAADGQAAMVTAANSTFRLPIVPIAALREPPILGAETGRVEVDAKIARDLFVRPAFAAADDVSRAYLSGIFLQSVGENLVAVATDGVRLCRITVPSKAAFSSDRTLIIPNEMVQIIDRLLGEVSGTVILRRSQRLFGIEGPGVFLISRRIDASYPSYERCIPSGGPNFITMSRAKLGQALARFSAVAAPEIQPHAVRLSWDAGGLRLHAHGSEDCLAADVEGAGETALQTHQLADIVGALRGNIVRISVGEPGTMILISDPNDATFLAGQMPIRPRSS